ncbi:MAG TPA: hypothetical protein VFW65_28540 [Pseudonocardiaceae bacterium]|nr:hypothetical protein [Pseudonocardiaceae bacterium]
MAGVEIPPNNGFMADLLDDTRNRPVVFQTQAEPGQHRLRPHVRMLAGATLVVAALAGAAGITFGGSALWSVLGTSDVPNTKPLWLPPPKGVTTPLDQSRHTATVDRDRTAITDPTTTHHPSATHVPGADDPSNHDATEHTATAAPNTGTNATQAPTEGHNEPEPTDDHHRGAGGGGPHGGGSSGHG